jgi:hypothetical protein
MGGPRRQSVDGRHQQEYPGQARPRCEDHGIENARIAIRMCRIKQKRIMSEAQAAHAKTAFGESA